MVNVDFVIHTEKSLSCQLPFELTIEERESDAGACSGIERRG